MLRQIFKNPATERYETRDEYLSGNVREKLAQAENAATQDPSYQKNADALRKVVPEDLIPDEICVTMGAPWIPASAVQALADHITGRAGSLSVKFIPSNAKWVVDGYGHSGKYEAKGIDLSDLLSDILNNKAIEIYSGRGENRTLDREATDAASVIGGDMKEDFRTWLWSDKARAKRLARYYRAQAAPEKRGVADAPGRKHADRALRWRGQDVRDAGSRHGNASPGHREQAALYPAKQRR